MQFTSFFHQILLRVYMIVSFLNFSFFILFAKILIVNKFTSALESYFVDFAFSYFHSPM